MSSCPASSQDDISSVAISHVASSPPPSAASIKPIKPPPITPRRFQRFFTPRTKPTPASLSRSGRQLRDITRNGANRGIRPTRRSSLGKRVLFEGVDSENTTETPVGSPAKKRRGLPTPESSPLQSSPIRAGRGFSPAIQIAEDEEEEEQAARRRITSPSPFEDPVFPEPIRRVTNLGKTARIVSRSFGGASTLGRGSRRDHCADWQTHTASFYSCPDYRYSFRTPRLPFCVASGNSNDLIALGEESGGVTIRNSTVKSSERSIALALKSHSNAVMDVAFSPDDSLLATASGDQQSHIIDVRTSVPIMALKGHVSSVKQIRFQPKNDKMVATSSRDGSIRLWDLRCQGTNYAFELPNPDGSGGELTLSVPHLPAYNTILSAHGENQSSSTASTSDVAKEVGSHTLPSGRRGVVSVTALSFLGHGREHLLLSGSEASTRIRLWDIRGRYSRRGAASPISCTALPEAHRAHRHYGINSIVVSTNESRFYALSRDNTIYAYSTNHLMLGSAPELSTNLKRTTRYTTADNIGLGPLYGFRHPGLHATSFYVKAALRESNDDQPELLAVGSSDAAPILFPTDELFLNKPVRVDEQSDSPTRQELPPVQTQPTRGPRPPLSRLSSNTGSIARATDTIPIYDCGTALVRGHGREVTGLTWTRKGELVTVSDDYTARIWKEGDRARQLRTKGEAEGRRWGCGWADVAAGFDDDSDDDD